METEAQKKAKELINLFGAVELGETEIGHTYTMDCDGIEEPKTCALLTVRELLREHSCYTLNNERWTFWAQVEIEINAL